MIDGRLYVTSNAGYVYSLDADTGCVHWSFRSQAVVRSGFTVGRMSRSSERLAVFFGDIHGMAYALDASTGEVIWKMQTDPHPLARITGTPVLSTVGSTSRSHRSKSQNPDRPTTRVASSAAFSSALDAATGKPIWKTYTIAEAPKVVGKNSRGKDMLGRPVPASG